MKISSSLFVFALTAAILLAGFALHLNRESTRIRGQAENSNAEARRSEDNLQKTTEQLRKAEEKRLTLQNNLNTPTKTVAPSLPLDKIDFQSRLDADPKLQVLSRNARHSTLYGQYATLFRQLRLSPTQADALVDLVLRDDEEIQDISATVRTQGYSRGDPAIGKLTEQANIDFAAAERALLGDEGAGQAKEYERSAPLRDLVAGIAGGATLMGTTFSAEQLEKLVRILAASNADFQAGKPAISLTIDWEVVDAQAREILSEEQFHLFQTVEVAGPNRGSSRASAQFEALIGRVLAEEKKRGQPTTSKPPG